MTAEPDPGQAPIALDDMTGWLAYPTELGQQPDEIEHIRTIQVDTPDGPADLFVFRFRTDDPHWAGRHGWMIGVSGPYLRSQQPSTLGLGYTFSRLTREDAMTMQEHVEDLIGPVAAWASRSPRSRIHRASQQAAFDAGRVTWLGVWRTPTDAGCTTPDGSVVGVRPTIDR